MSWKRVEHTTLSWEVERPNGLITTIPAGGSIRMRAAEIELSTDEPASLTLHLGHELAISLQEHVQESVETLVRDGILFSPSIASLASTSYPTGSLLRAGLGDNVSCDEAMYRFVQIIGVLGKGHRFPVNLPAPYVSRETYFVTKDGARKTFGEDLAEKHYPK